MSEVMRTAISDIANTGETLPVKREKREFPEAGQMCFVAFHAQSEKDIWKGLEGWEHEGENGADAVMRACYIFAVKEALSRLDFAEYDSINDMLTVCNQLENQSNYRNRFNSQISLAFTKYYPKFITSELRDYAVKLHARGNSTVNVVKHIISPATAVPNPFRYLVEFRANLEKSIIKWLTPRLAHLKMGTASFPKKYHTLWHQEREAYLSEIRGITLTNTTEQVKALSELYQRLEDAFSESETDKGKAMLASSMVKVMSGLFTLTRDPSLGQ